MATSVPLRLTCAVPLPMITGAPGTLESRVIVPRPTENWTEITAPPASASVMVIDPKSRRFRTSSSQTVAVATGR